MICRYHIFTEKDDSVFRDLEQPYKSGEFKMDLAWGLATAFNQEQQADTESHNMQNSSQTASPNGNLLSEVAATHGRAVCIYCPTGREKPWLIGDERSRLMIIFVQTCSGLDHLQPSSSYWQCSAAL